MFSVPVTVLVLCYLNWLTQKLSVVYIIFFYITTKALISLQIKHSGVCLFVCFFPSEFAFSNLGRLSSRNLNKG